jgi:hypothetical protein
MALLCFFLKNARYFNKNYNKFGILEIRKIIESCYREGEEGICGNDQLSHLVGGPDFSDSAGNYSYVL